MLSNFEIDHRHGGNNFKVNLNRNHIRSISAFSSNSIFYFTTIVSDQITPEEVAMTSKMLERSYASFVVACISLMPFHRISADDQASVEEYLSQFHQNLGIDVDSKSTMVFGKALGLAADLQESVSAEDLKQTQDFLLECWEKSRKNCSNFVKVVNETISLNDMYNLNPIDPMTRTMQAAYKEKLDELNTWGFLGEASLDLFDLPEGGEYIPDADIIRGAFDYSPDDDNDDEYDEDIDDDDYDLDALIDNRSVLVEGNVKQAINSIMFALEGVSENKILSCPSLAKLNSLEAKLKKLKTKYARYLTRYKRKYKENKKNGTKQKLVIRFNGANISNPKAFMKQYGGYIKIINKRLKLVEKRRSELRKRKGLPDHKMEESAILIGITDTDLMVMDKLVEDAERQLLAPDDEAFVLNEAKGGRGGKGKGNGGGRSSSNSGGSNSNGNNNGGNGGSPKNTGNNNGGNTNNKNTGNADNYDKEFKDLRDRVSKMEKTDKKLRTEQLNNRITNLERSQRYDSDYEEPDMTIGDVSVDAVYDNRRPKGGVNLARAARRGYTGTKTFDKEVFTNMEMKKANEALPTFTHATIGFVIDETEEVVNRDILLGIKVQLHKIPAKDLIDDIYNCIINKRKFLKFVKFISGEEKSLADLVFGFKELKLDAINSTGARRWNSAFRRRRRWSKMSIPYLMKNYTPNGTVVMTMNEVQFIRDEYGIDIMRPDHVKMIMDMGFLLGFVILDQANEVCYVTYDGHNGEFQMYTYAMLDRESTNSDRMVRELYRAMSR